MVRISDRTMRDGWCLMSILLMAILALAPATQVGAETAKFMVSSYITGLEQVQVAGTEGHYIGIASRRGLTFFENGEVMTYEGWETYDLDDNKGKSFSQGYGVYRLMDGTKYVIKYECVGTATQDGKTWLYEGTCEYITGTGRFEGITGNGSYSGKGVAFYSEEKRIIDDMYLDFTMTYTFHSE